LVCRCVTAIALRSGSRGIAPLMGLPEFFNS
jgi:hypothetical protein